MTDTGRESRRRRKAEMAFHALGKHRGNTKEAARDQGIAETTLRKRVAEYCELMGYLTPFEAAWRYSPREDMRQ